MASAGAFKSFHRDAKNLPYTMPKKNVQQRLQAENKIKQLFHSRLLVMR